MNIDEARVSLKQIIRSTADVPEDLVDKLIVMGNLVHYQKGKHLIMAGEIPDTIGFNLDGIFRFYYTDEEGNESTKSFSIKGKPVISYSALVQRRPSYFSIEALSDVSVLQFPFDLWKEVMDSDLRWCPFTFKLVEAVYIMKEMRERSLLLENATTRYLNFRKDYPDLEGHIKLYHIASFLGMTPETLSRVRNKLNLT